LTPVSRSPLMSSEAAVPSMKRIFPAATSCCIFCTDAGAARKSGRRCTSVRAAAFSASPSVQSSAESPPPKITSFFPWKSAAVVTR
jgi:hypothetical protein